MAAWHRSRKADLGLRALGIGLCAVAYCAIARLVAIAQPPQTAGVLAFVLAAIGFMSASAGSAMTFLGNHLFDEIEVSSRWQHRPTDNAETQARWPGSNW